MAAGEDLYTLHAEALAGLDPDLILTQDLCRVCAFPSGQVDDALGYLGCRADVLSPRPALAGRRAGHHPAVGDAGRRRRPGGGAGRRVCGRRLRPVAAAVAGRPRPRVAVVEWVDPPFTAGHWVPDLVPRPAANRSAARPGERSVQTTWAEIRADARRTWCWSRRAASTWTARPSRPRSVLTELPGAPVWAIDADGIVVRPGPRLVDGVEAIAAILHPEPWLPAVDQRCAWVRGRALHRQRRALAPGFRPVTSL